MKLEKNGRLRLGKIKDAAEGEAIGHPNTSGAARKNEPLIEIVKLNGILKNTFPNKQTNVEEDNLIRRPQTAGIRSPSMANKYYMPMKHQNKQYTECWERRLKTETENTHH